MTIKVTVKESTLVQPAEKTQKLSLWTSNVDQLFRMHVPSVFFYKPRQQVINGGSYSSTDDHIFDSSVLKEGLSKALVSFYPIAGRLKRDEKDGRVEIDCTGEGVLFSEAETDSVIDDLCDFIPNQQLQPLIPKVDTSKDLSSFPLLLVQVTRFKCGGVCLGVAMDHTVADGASGLHFINTWAEVSRGLDIISPPFMDRTLLRARDPPTPSFPHIEHHPPPSMKKLQTSTDPPPPENPTTTTTTIAMFKISRHQINLLKSKSNEGLDENPVRFSTYEVISGHVWRCACKARRLDDDQDTMISIATDGRTRLNPPLPTGYLGNAIFHLTPIAVSGDLLSRPLSYAVSKIHETLIRGGDDEYYKSAIDYLELHPDLRTLVRGPHTFNCPNIGVTSWARLPIYEADFGWGKPVYMGPGAIIFEGLCYLLPTPPGGTRDQDGTLLIAMSLQSDHMDLFKDYFYDI